MPFQWFVALRYLRDAKGQTALILAAVSVGVSVVVFLSALINGLQTSLIESTLGSQPHVTLRVARKAPRPLAQPPDGVTIASQIQPASQRLRSIDQWPGILTTVEGRPRGHRGVRDGFRVGHRDTCGGARARRDPGRTGRPVPPDHRPAREDATRDLRHLRRARRDRIRRWRPISASAWETKSGWCPPKTSRMSSPCRASSGWAARRSTKHGW